MEGSLKSVASNGHLEPVSGSRLEKDTGIAASSMVQQAPPRLEEHPVVDALLKIASELHELNITANRIADAVAPQPADIVGTPYVASRLGTTRTWIAQLVREGGIPEACLVRGTGKGRLWKFHRREVDRWIDSRA